MSPDPEPDLVDRIAQDLPADVRAAYYRELNHCRSLPESDEMLPCAGVLRPGSAAPCELGSLRRSA